MPGELPQFSMFPCSHDLFFSYEKEKEGRKWKESCLSKGRFLYSYVLLRFGNAVGLMLWCAPPSGERMSTETFPYNIPSSIANKLIAISVWEPLCTSAYPNWFGTWCMCVCVCVWNPKRLVTSSLHRCSPKLVWYIVHVCETLKDRGDFLFAPVLYPNWFGTWYMCVKP
jgi:hypothetical protein